MKFIITDGASLKAGCLESCMEDTEGYMIFVNGSPFDNAHAAEIMKFLSEERILTPFEAGLSVYTAISFAKEHANENDMTARINEVVFLVSSGLSLQLKEEIKRTFFKRNILGEKNLRFITKKPDAAEAEKENKTGKSEKADKENKDVPVKEDGPAPGHAFVSVPAAEKKPEKEAEGKSVSPFRKVPEKPEKKRQKKSAEKKTDKTEGKEKKDVSGTAKTKEEENLPDFTGITVKTPSGRITGEASGKILSLAGKYPPAVIAEASGLSKPAVYRILRNGGEQEEKEQTSSLKERGVRIKTSSAVAEEDTAEEVSVHPQYSPIMIKKMKEAMVYDKRLGDIADMRVAGLPLSGNIITDAQLALSCRLTESDKLALTYAFYLSNSYEEDFIRNLADRGFTKINMAFKLKDLCENYAKIRRITVLSKNTDKNAADGIKRHAERPVANDGKNRNNGGNEVEQKRR